MKFSATMTRGTENTEATVKHGDGGIMVWDWFAVSRTAALYKVDKIIKDLRVLQPQTISQRAETWTPLGVLTHITQLVKE